MPVQLTTRHNLKTNPNYWVDLKLHWTRGDALAIGAILDVENDAVPTPEQKERWGLEILSRVIVAWNLDGEPGTVLAITRETIRDALPEIDYNFLLDLATDDRLRDIEKVPNDPNASAASSPPSAAGPLPQQSVASSA